MQHYTLNNIHTPTIICYSYVADWTQRSAANALLPYEAPRTQQGCNMLYGFHFTVAVHTPGNTHSPSRLLPRTWASVFRVHELAVCTRKNAIPSQSCCELCCLDAALCSTSAALRSNKTHYQKSLIKKNYVCYNKIQLNTTNLLRSLTYTLSGYSQQ